MSVATARQRQQQRPQRLPRSLGSYVAQAVVILSVGFVLMLAVRLSYRYGKHAKQASSTTATPSYRGQWTILTWDYTNAHHDLCARIERTYEPTYYIVTMFRHDATKMSDTPYWKSSQQFDSDAEALRMIADVCDNKASQSTQGEPK